MAILLIDEIAKEAIKKLREHAHSNPYTIDMMLDRMNKQLPPPGDVPENVCYIHDGFKCVFTIETNGTQTVKHLSISTKRLGRYPTPEAVAMLMEEFGFVAKTIHEVDQSYLEESVEAVNVIEYIK